MAISMTGFGRGEFKNDSYHFLVECKTINHKYCDINVRLPRKISFLEDKIRNYVKNFIKRGRVDLYIKLDLIGSEDVNLKFDDKLATQYVNILKEIKILEDEKNKIENCLKNFRVQYWILSILPITPILSTLIVSMLYIYTGKSHINFSIIVQRIILFVWIADIILFALPQFCKIKRNLFPCVEFRVGQNENIENKYSKMRNFLCVTVFGTVFLGIIVNIISKFIGIG